MIYLGRGGSYSQVLSAFVPGHPCSIPPDTFIYPSKKSTGNEINVQFALNRRFNIKY